MEAKDNGGAPTDDLLEAILLLELFKAQVGHNWFKEKSGIQGYNSAISYLRRIWKAGIFDGK